VTEGPGGTLYVVATPIGNLSDVTFRAVEVLGAVPLIAAEDTRLTRRLLDRHGITTRTISFHARSGPSRLGTLLEHLRAGADLALTTDAGTPAVSDPGADLVEAWAAEGGRVVPVPGASAVLAAVSATGVAGPRWGFEGFLPRSGRERRERLTAIASDHRGTVIFEAPNRVGATLRDLAAACGPERRAAVCRELTKVHEQIVPGSIADLLRAVDEARVPARGEFVLVIGGGSPGAESAVTPDALHDALASVERLVAGGTARGTAAREVAKATGIPRRRLYEPSRRP
jgi:16S rRNA (cytidine1402-2'-O)-methyltransferase